ncbi:lactoylglutathione lyase [Capronia coronata CBS 617.96]|uniref:Lactoylglutathione lyase n=1 Tax=Capronia coronata CBS 617.96 TaxID=1182541 RepID=W9YFM9_9EURO|nr:lactoylglutathione lyase [Capronia coronata CBS 617.96]EXJ88061.1 lactoylglutathione lyase [Capronia coronata CBS 617.96]
MSSDQQPQLSSSSRLQSEPQPSSHSSTNPSPFPHGVFLPNGLQTDPPFPPNPKDDPTHNYKLNHFMLRIRDPAPSLHFYITLMGMRTVFTMNVGPFTIYYLGYPQTEAHRRNLARFGADTAANLQHTLGLLELYHVHGSEKQDVDYYATGTGNVPPHLGFGHLGLTVPDVAVAVDRLEANGVEVVKGLGVCTRQSIPISDWEVEEKGVGVEVEGTDSQIHAEYSKIFEKIAFVRDPVSFTCLLRVMSNWEYLFTTLSFERESRSWCPS